MRDSQTSPYSPWSHWLAVSAMTLTFPLLWIGGLVTTTKSGMAVPDWPSTYGYNLLLYPWQTWVFGPWDLMVEHGHRLLGTLVGLVTIALWVSLWRQGRGLWLAGGLALLGVIAQGVLGGVRVEGNARTIAMVHGCVGPLFFAFTVWLASATTRLWRDVPAGTSTRVALSATIAAALVYLQLVLGATLRHSLVTWTPAAFRLLVVMHVAMALLVVWQVFRLRWQTSDGSTNSLVCRFARLSVLTIVVQLALGLATWRLKYAIPGWLAVWIGTPPEALLADGWWQTTIITAHQATGSLLLALLVAAAGWSWRSREVTTVAFPSSPVAGPAPVS